MKQELAEKAERIGELSQENIDMEAKIEELAEQHKSVTLKQIIFNTFFTIR